MRHTAPIRLLLILACLAAALGHVPVARADSGVSETALDPAGAAYEVNADAQGLLWISDYDKGQVRGLYAEDGYFEVYPVLGHPSDARHDGTHLWWVDAASNIVGRASTADGTVTRWAVPGAAGFFGTALDAAGRLWFTAADASQLYRLDAAAAPAELCTYTLPDGGQSAYLAGQDGYLWLGDHINGRMLRLRVSDNSLTAWPLPPGTAAFGLAVDAEGRLWYADTGGRALARLAADGQLDSYSLPQGKTPRMVALRGREVWYTEQGLAGIGRLDPQQAAHTTGSLLAAQPTLAGSCAAIAAADSGQLTITNIDVDWHAASYPVTVNERGWQVYQAPEDAAPWGIAAGTSDIWFVDTARHVLGRLAPETSPAAHRVYLPLVIR